MKSLILLVAVVLVGCVPADPSKSSTPDTSKLTNVVEIADPTLKQIICEKIKMPHGKLVQPVILTEADLAKVTELDLHSKKLTEVPKGLEKLTQLKELYIYNNQLTDVTGLAKLKQLKYLNLHSNQLTEVKGLEKLTQLTVLNLRTNELTDVTGLEKLDQLTELWLQDNPALTKAQIAELQKALPKCRIFSNPTK